MRPAGASLRSSESLGVSALRRRGEERSCGAGRAGGGAMSCSVFLAVAGVFFALGFVLQVLLINQLHLQSAEEDVLDNIKSHLPFGLRREEQLAHVAADEPRPEPPPSREEGKSLFVLPNVSRQEDSHTVPFSAAGSTSVSMYRERGPSLGGGNGSRYYRDIIGEVPQIVQSWRNAKLDWHDLLPKHMSTWERFGERKGLRLLVSKEEQITDYLTRFKESGLADAYGHDHGPLLDYSGCNKFRSDCMIHAKDVCQTNGLCMWDSQLQLCVDFDVNSPHGKQEEGAPPNGRVGKCSKQGNRGIPSDKGVLKVKEKDSSCKVCKHVSTSK